ncbi:MAG: tRNA (guanosine(37)-N1)-methyltransferase TrmD [Chthoniobacterales bacterium]
MRIDVLTLFPEMCEGPLTESMMRRAQKLEKVEIKVHNIRDWAQDKHRVTDEPPYGGGPGMVLKIEPIYEALKSLRGPESRVIYLSPQGQPFVQKQAEQLAEEQHLIFLCGHYEGVDERVVKHLVDEQISIGDYVLTNGVLPALVVIDTVVRLIPGVLGDSESANRDSFSTGELDYPHYTRPAEFMGWKVPEVLLSGNHAAIEQWRQQKAAELTRERRPDLAK